jgi:hypothetical protein
LTSDPNGVLTPGTSSHLIIMLFLFESMSRNPPRLIPANSV